MEAAKNMLKEIDMQIVYRRLDARKKDITRDGKIPKQRLANAYRGYYGMEEQYNALLHKSNEAYYRTKADNNILQHKHAVDMKKIQAAEHVAREQSERSIQAIRDEFQSMLAYQYVYKEHSFKRYDTHNRERAQTAFQRPVAAMSGFSEFECKPASMSIVPRPLGSLRDSDVSSTATPLKLPPIHNGRRNGEDQSQSTINVLGETWYDDGMFRSVSRSSFVGEDGKITSFPSIQTALGVEIKVKYKAHDADEQSFVSAPPKLRHDTVDDTTGFGSQPMNIMNGKEQEPQEKRRKLPLLPQKDDASAELKRRLLPQTPKRPSSMLLRGASTSIGMRKFMKKEVNELLEYWDKNMKRIEDLEKAKRLDASKPKPVINRTMTTTEILNDFKRYKEDLQSIKEQKETEQPVVIRQMSPQPRPASPVCQRMSEYSNRIQTPQPKKTGKDKCQSPAPERERAKPKRKMPELRPTMFQELTESQKRLNNEKFPSVSRTTSYQDIPDNTGELHENALLTAAERIEKERQKMYGNKEMDRIVMVVSDEEDESDKNPTKEKRYKVKRKLPVPPAATKSVHNAEKLHKVKQKKPEKYFDTSTFGTNSDLDTINRVEAANNPTRLARKPPPAPSMNPKKKWKLNLSPTKEHSSLKQKASGKLANDQGKENVSFLRSTTDAKETVRPDFRKMQLISSFSGKPVSQQVARMMHSNYDNYSRTHTPDMKQQLEVMAKRKRKLQLENAKLIHAKYTEPRKETSSVVDSEPSTKVSFNEKVTVYHDQGIHV